MLIFRGQRLVRVGQVSLTAPPSSAGSLHAGRREAAEVDSGTTRLVVVVRRGADCSSWREDAIGWPMVASCDGSVSTPGSAGFGPCPVVGLCRRQPSDAVAMTRVSSMWVSPL